MSIMRTYFIWQLAESRDKSYMLAAFGLWSDAELSVGLLIGCCPVMPRFFQHVRPKLSEAFSLSPKSVSNLSHHPKGRSKTPTMNARAKIKSPLAKYKFGSVIAESITDPYTQLHAEYYTLSESEASQRQAISAFAPAQVPDAGIATRRGDLEYGHPGF